MKRKAMVSIYPDGCECSARDRCICSQACKPTRHKIRCAVVTGKGKCNCGAKPKLYGGKLQDQVNQMADSRRTKFPLGKPLYVHMTEGRKAANEQAERERTFAEKWHAVSGLIYIHPCDFHIGMIVHWHRKGQVLHGTVVKVNEDMLKPAKVLRKGPVRYHYTPSVYAFCDAEGGKPCVCDLPIGQRTECQKRPNCPIPGIDMEMHSGVKLMQGHSPAALACVPQARNRQLEVYAHGAFHSSNLVPDMVIAGSMMGPGEYAKQLTIDPLLGDYCVRAFKDGHGIYLRSYNVRLATFAPNSAALRERLSKLFDDAKAKDKSDDEIARGLAKWGKMSIAQRIKVRQKRERAANKGWYTCQCGQWVNDKECPCSVCVKPKRKPRKKK